jgi:hypothetical protein
MEERITAIYAMVRKEELKEEDADSYEIPLASQKAEHFEFLKRNVGEDDASRTEIYTSRKQLLMDVECHRVKRLVVRGLDRRGSFPE